MIPTLGECELFYLNVGQENYFKSYKSCVRTVCSMSQEDVQRAIISIQRQRTKRISALSNEAWREELKQWSSKQMAWLKLNSKTRRFDAESDVEENEQERAELDGDSSDDDDLSIETPRKQRRSGTSSSSHRVRTSAPVSVLSSTYQAGTSTTVSSLTHNSAQAPVPAATHTSTAPHHTAPAATHTSTAPHHTAPVATHTSTAPHLTAPVATHTSTDPRLTAPVATHTSTAPRLTAPVATHTSTDPRHTAPVSMSSSSSSSSSTLAPAGHFEQDYEYENNDNYDSKYDSNYDRSYPSPGPLSGLETLAEQAAQEHPRPVPSASSSSSHRAPSATGTAGGNQALYTRLDQWQKAYDTDFCDPSASLDIRRQPKAAYYHTLSTAALAAQLPQNSTSLQRLHKPTVSLYQPNARDYSYYISYEDTDNKGFGRLFMRIDIESGAATGYLGRWAFDPLHAEYNLVRAVFDLATWEMLRFQQLLHMMHFFFTYQSVTKSDISQLLVIAVDPHSSAETSSFFKEVVNGGLPFERPNIVYKQSKEPVLRVNEDTFDRLVQRYLFLYRDYHRKGADFLPKALTIAERAPILPTLTSKHTHPIQSNTSKG